MHKALVPVLGVPLLERNLRALFGQGFLEVGVAVAHDEPAIHAFLETRAAELAQRYGGRLTTHVERTPLGTIGAARAFRSGRAPVLIINVDNLSAIDLQAFVRTHERSGAAMTIAIHEEAFPIPFGEVRVEDDAIVAYLEKPEHRVLISSGTYVLAPSACALLAPDQPIGIPALIDALHAGGHKVAAYRHDAAWVDVNDADGLRRAEAMLLAHPEQFAWEPQRT